MEILVAENITKQYTDNNLKVDIIKDISVKFYKGMFTTIMGPSGAGKSTFLYILGGLIPPTSGNIILDGKKINSLSDKNMSTVRRREMGFIFQFYNLVPVLSVEENIALPLLLDKQDIKKYKNRINQLIDIVGLSHRKRHKPTQLSGGEQQRVAIARALVAEPKIILADEPTGNLDSKNSKEIIELLKNLCENEKKTIITVTHDPDIAKCAERRIVIRDGNIEKDY